ncbi:MAG: hypothetical protein A2X35_01405 [Elusimicrobia bacterium GWA2_61_42]|nr:MAG: hypothetical protein A2X35_01405 [Elusimicrobia bacterium GWA2_61_42]OGR76804.1 MAG: hypothetical protein A2X38_11580 [Elusimicrobia bacterium GWC2_61_25]
MKKYLIGLLLLGGCATTDSRVYRQDQLAGSKVWLVDFTYDSGSVERLQKKGEEEVKVVSTGQNPSDLQLRDDIFFLLQDDYGVSVTKDESKATGKILMHALHFSGGGFKRLTVVLENMQRETIARLKIENGDRPATFKDDDSFAKYAAKSIAGTITER